MPCCELWPLHATWRGELLPCFPRRHRVGAEARAHLLLLVRRAGPGAVARASPLQLYQGIGSCDNRRLLRGLLHGAAARAHPLLLIRRARPLPYSQRGHRVSAAANAKPLHRCRCLLQPTMGRSGSGRRLRLVLHAGDCQYVCWLRLIHQGRWHCECRSIRQTSCIPNAPALPLGC